jgi:hypothetical protein
MCNEKDTFRELMIALVLVNMFDLYATQYLLSTGMFYEVNYWIGGLGTARFINVAVMKLVCLSAFVTFGMHCVKPGRIVMLTLASVMSVYVCLMLYHIYLISFTTVIL